MPHDQRLDRCKSLNATIFVCGLAVQPIAAPSSRILGFHSRLISMRPELPNYERGPSWISTSERSRQGNFSGSVAAAYSIILVILDYIS